MFQFSKNYLRSALQFHCLSERFYATKNNPTNLKKWSKSSQDWMIRHLNDPYVKRAKMENYRARSAFKLIEIDDKFKFLHPGQLVVDIGASPGAWTQVAVSRINAHLKDPSKKIGKVVSNDLSLIIPVPGATVVTGDFTLNSTQELILQKLDGLKPDAILSDMAPNAIGVRSLDNECIVNLALAALVFAVKNLKPGGTFLCKVWNGAEVTKLETNMIKFFESVRRVKPVSSRTDSSEIFFLGRSFKGIT
ncbi:hypothetical protein CHUAL_003677 [Chamberlinius hualienensis]